MRYPILLCTLLALGCNSSRAEPPPSDKDPAEAPPGTPPTFTVGSYNVLYLRAEKRPGSDAASWADPDTLRQVEALDVDVLLLQETNEAWEGAIRAALSKRFQHCVFHHPKRFLPEGLAICSRYPLEEDGVLASSVGWFPAQRARLRAPFGPVELLNVHLRPAVAGPEGWMAVHRATRPDRKKEVEAYLAALPAGAATLIVGDFNELPEGDLFQSLTAAGFDSALPRARTTSATWRWEGTTPLLEAQLDHVTYTSSMFELVSASVGRGGNSDHVPVVVTLRPRR